MKAMITGTDSLSKRILIDLENKVKVSAIPDHYPVSLDQAKRLSRYLTILQQAKTHLTAALYEKVELLGLKILPLAKLFKDGDWEGLTEILSVVTDETKRDELDLMIKGLAEKRERIRDFKEASSYKIQQLEAKEQEIIQKEKQLQVLQEEIEKEIAVLKKYPHQDFLLEHIGLYEGKWVLAKRLDVNWQRALKKKGTIRYSGPDYVYYVEDLNGLLEHYEKRLKHGRKCLWDYEIDIEKINGDIYYIPKDGRYKTPTGLATDLRSAKAETRKELAKIKKDQKAIAAELKSMKKTTVKTYMESVEATNNLSIRDLKHHGSLQDAAMKWLYSQGYIVISELTLSNNRRVDVFAYNQSGQIVIVEVKVSLSDLLQDQKWREYLNYCDEFYFLTPEYLSNYASKVDEKCGQLIHTSKGVQIERDDRLQHDVLETDRDELIFSAARLLAKKMLFGY